MNHFIWYGKGIHGGQQEGINLLFFYLPGHTTSGGYGAGKGNQSTGKGRLFCFPLKRQSVSGGIKGYHITGFFFSHDRFSEIQGREQKAGLFLPDLSVNMFLLILVYSRGKRKGTVYLRKMEEKSRQSAQMQIQNRHRWE
jgi:hypothetical protein